MRMNSQTRIIVATAIVLAAVDIAVRLHTAPRAPVSSGVVTAREFRLTDDRGNVRATMTVDRSGEPGLRMYDRDGTLRLQLDTWQNTPSLILLDRNENRRVYYGMENADGSGLLQMLSPNGTPLAELNVTGDTPDLTLYKNGATTRMRWDGRQYSSQSPYEPPAASYGYR